MRLLAFLDSHPLVRRIELPPLVTRTVDDVRYGARASAAGGGRERPQAVAVPIRNTSQSYPRLGIIEGGVAPVLADWTIGRWALLDATDIDAAHGTFIGSLIVHGGS
jgi:hypothetical protein